jgi:hypothetical protein
MTLSTTVACATVLSIGTVPWAVILVGAAPEIKQRALKEATRAAFRFARKLHKLSVKAGN